MDLRFYIDPETDDLHIHRHGVEEHEVCELMESPGEEFKVGKGKITALGQTDAGRYLRVIYYCDRDDGIPVIITAYDLVGNALRAYKARRRKKR